MNSKVCNNFISNEGRQIRTCLKLLCTFGLIAGGLCTAPTDSMASEQVAARTQRTNVPGPDGATRRQWSPLVQDIQTALRRLNLYDGPNNGVLNLTTERAIQTYQRRRKLDVDGLPTTKLLLQMNGLGHAGALNSKLETARKTQIAAARLALQANPGTRDLVDANLAPRAHESQFDRLSCEQNPTQSCLLNMAVQTATSIARLDYRDWANRDIIQTLASLGRFDEARNTIKKLTDPRLTIVSLRETAVALAHGGKFTMAEQVARLIPDPANKARAYAAIAAEYAQSSRPELAKAATAAMQREFRLTQDKLAVVDIAASLSVSLARRGAAVMSKSILHDLQTSLTKLPNDSDKRAVFSMLATAYAKIGALAEAEAILKPYHTGAKQPMYLATVEYLAKRGEVERAIASLKHLRQPRHYVAAMHHIAKAQAKAANASDAHATLTRAMNAVADIERPFALDIALTQIAEAWIYSADFANAQKTLRKVGDHVLRARSLWKFATTAKDIGFVEQAEALKISASKATEEIPSAFDRTATLLHATQLEILSHQGSAARQMFQRALREAGGIRGAWWRARIYARLAATIPSL
jgi:hypothetical protein